MTARPCTTRCGGNDAAYIALAEGFACPLVTGDPRLHASPAIDCEIEVLAVDT
jgi:predicted nucleic acid-binding protein